MGKTHLIIPDSHAHPEHNNDRANWVGQLILDIKPDVVVNLGDMWDLPSLSGYDVGKKSFHGRSYKKDLEAGLDFDERLWHYIKKAKKKRPRRVFIEGNHEYRLKKAVDMQYQELDEVIGFKDFDLNRNYDDIVEYEGSTPGIINIDNIHYAHYFVSGVMGRPLGGEHPAYSLLTKHFTSCTAGHIHVFDHSIRTTVSGKKIVGCVAGVYQDYDSGWAGEVNKLWWRGVVVKRNVEDGYYDLEQISIDSLRREYGE